MPAPNLKQEIIELPLKMVGGNLFGRYNKISVEETWNMIVSDTGLVPYAGYKNVKTQSAALKGRGLYSSSRGNLMVAVWGTSVFRIKISGTGLIVISTIGSIVTASGDVFMAENNNGEIAITDGVHIYIYNWFAATSPSLLETSTTGVVGTNQFAIPTALVNPGYISFQNGRFITVNTSANGWYLSGANAGTTWPSTAPSVGALETKPDKIQAAVPSPGGGNNLYIFGRNVVEQWQDVGAARFPYQKASTFNVDYGTLNASSIAAMDDYIVWLAANEQSGATLMVIEGNKSTSISTDGIDFKLANLTNPTNCTGFLFRQDGHVIYQFAFPDDNLSYIYDFKAKQFFTVTDHYLNYHIARDVVYFNNTYYFVSLKGGNLFEFSTKYTDADYGGLDVMQLPRLRICPPVRLPSQRMYIIKSVGFTVENGQPNNKNEAGQTTEPSLLGTEGGVVIATENGVELGLEGTSGPDFSVILYNEAIDLSISRDGGETFGNEWRQWQNLTGHFKSRVDWQRCGQANDASLQFRFSGYGRFVAFDGVTEVYL